MIQLQTHMPFLVSLYILSFGCILGTDNNVKEYTETFCLGVITRNCLSGSYLKKIVLKGIRLLTENVVCYETVMSKAFCSSYLVRMWTLESLCLAWSKRYYARGASARDGDRIPTRLKTRIAKYGNDGSGTQDPASERSVDAGLHHSKSIPSNVPPSASSQFPQDAEELKKLVQSMTVSSQEEATPPQDRFPSDMEKYRNWRRDQSRKAFRPKVDPRGTSIILFPGQGSQFVGMGKDTLAYGNAQELFEEASELLKYDLLKVCLHGPQSKLSKTIHCQSAVFVTSLAAVEKLREQNPEAIENCVGTAGFSIGEYAALVFAGAMTFSDAVKIVHSRAEAMQKASEEVSSGMMTVFLGNDSKLKTAMLAAREYCRQRCSILKPVCEVANYLTPDCKVIAGHTEALEFIATNAKSFGIRRTKRLPVSGAFHTSLMISAETAVSESLKKVSLSEPEICVYSNLTASFYRQERKIYESLPKQITFPVKWEQIMHVLYSRPQGENFPQTYEVGPGQQLGTLLKMVNLKAYQSYTSVAV